MNSLYHHISWFCFLFVLFIVSLLFSFYVSYSNLAYNFYVGLFSLWNNDIVVSFCFDYISTTFSTVILLISSVIIVYSYNYMAPYSNSIYFLWLTNLFILSMLIVVNISNIFFLMLGWDGLGLVSFFLIVYYQNQSSITSGVFTLLINRLGDSLFLFTIVLFFYESFSSVGYSFNLPSFTLCFFLLFTFMTKSAIYPFSPWLPLAIAAPTPISALVHSSTLVTSGLYLIIRFYFILYSNYYIMLFLLLCSIFTSFYAGLNTIVENDLKKLIALSTLSHLGFIGIAFSVGLLNLAFFHMLTHALFKSLLFITMGDIMINLNHSQDIRYLSSGISYTPMSCIIMYVSLLNLLGMPNLSGYFSNDLVLEILNYSFLSSISFLVIFINVFFTYFYTYQLFFYSFQSNNLFPYQNFHAPYIFHTLLLFVMGFSTLIFGFFFLSHIVYFSWFCPVPSVFNWAPLCINILVFSFLLSLTKLFTFSSVFLNYYFSNMIFLSNVMSTISSNIYFNLGFFLVKSTEQGVFNYTINTFSSLSFYMVSNVLFNFSIYHPLRLVFLSSFIVFFIFIFI